MAPTATIVDLTLDQEEACDDHSVCSICLKDDDKVTCCFHGTNSIQCNAQFGTLGSNLPKGIVGVNARTGCNAWFHKTCLKSWHHQCITKVQAFTCPLCRAKNTFVWAFADDYNLTDCIFKEDFLQYGLLSGSWDAFEVDEKRDVYNLCLGYRNNEMSDQLPFWVNNSRKYNGLLEAAIVGNDIGAVRVLLRNGVVIPGNPVYDMQIASIGDGDDTLLMLAAKAYVANETKCSLVFMEILNECESELQDTEQAVFFPNRLDVFLYAIKNGLVVLVQELIPFMLKKHPTKVLLQWCVMSGHITVTYVFPILFAAMQQVFSKARVEVAILGCADCPGLEGSSFELVYALVPPDLKLKFLLRSLRNAIFLDNRKLVEALMFNPVHDLQKIGFGVAEGHYILEALQETFRVSWSSKFDFREGVSYVATPHTASSFKRRLRVFHMLEKGLVRKAKKWPFTKINAEISLVPDNGIRSATYLRRMNDFHMNNIVEIVMLRLRCFDMNLQKANIHKLLLAAVRTLHIYRKSFSGELFDLVLRRLVAPIASYEPTSINEYENTENVLMYCAEHGLLDVCKRVFSMYEDFQPRYGTIVDSKLRTPIMVAISNEHLDFAKYLLTLDCVRENLAKIDANGRTALFSCCTSRTQPWLPKVDEGATRRSKRRCTVSRKLRKDMVTIAEKLLESYEVCMYINEQDKDGNTALHCAYANQNDDIVRLIESKKETRTDLHNKAGLVARQLKVE